MFLGPRNLGRFGAKVGVVSGTGDLRSSEATTDTKTPMGETKLFRFVDVLLRDAVALDVMLFMIKPIANW